ncbi:MAG: adenylate kinase [Akkermansiaceae bacterium]|jgi:adenylate kinase|nr:adenylate kinase [Akkermansiaceae bacterium]MCU0776803.1 adenylate kinase [Akkermansiaceae bacterium]
MLNIALFGPPGAGKGTQSAYLVERFNLIYISTGEMLRREMGAGTQLGEQARGIIAAGGLVSDEIIVQIIEKTITENPDASGFLFDGFPRTFVQAYILDGLMIKLNTSLNCLINLHIPEDISVSRLLRRGETSGRLDDNETVIRNRLREYHEKTVPVLQFYRDKGQHHDIDGTRPVEEVRDDIIRILEKELEKNLFNLVLFGYPGSGRGSQGFAIAEKFGLEYIATGSMIHEEIDNNTAIGREVTEMYQTGELVPDEIVVRLIEKRLANPKGARGFIFKGIPRTLVQSYILDSLLRKHGSGISKIINLDVPVLELVRRLDARSHTDRRMPYDASTGNIVKRLKEHETKTIPVINKYRQHREVVTIDGTGTFEQVFERLSAVVEAGMHTSR